jgi:glycosyltransferase involved in cell wall biosynthesis
VLAVGRLVPEKGFADLIAALGRLARPRELTIVGDGPEQDRLRRLAGTHGVALALTGRLAPATLRATYGLADVVVVPSHREGFGLVACEAACQGTPVVATDAGAARDVLDREWLVPPGDVAALAAAIEAVATDPAAARRRAGQVAERVRHALSPAAVAQRALTAYQAVGAG